MLLRSTAFLPSALKGSLARLAASPRLYNLTISNVPGPRVPLYAAGARVTGIYPVIPIPDRHALALGVLTYAGKVHFAGYADRDALPGLRHVGDPLGRAHRARGLDRTRTPYTRQSWPCGQGCGSRLRGQNLPVKPTLAPASAPDGAAYLPETRSTRRSRPTARCGPCIGS